MLSRILIGIAIIFILSLMVITSIYWASTEHYFPDDDRTSIFRYIPTPSGANGRGSEEKKSPPPPDQDNRAASATPCAR